VKQGSEVENTRVRYEGIEQQRINKKGNDIMDKFKLSDEEKERIRLEETYRYEIRKSLEDSKPKKSRIFEILNSPFVIWVLSAIMLSGLTSMYARYAAKAEASKAQSVRIQRIIADLQTRIERAKINLESYSDRTASFTTIERAEGAFDDFKDKDFLSMAIELQISRPDEDVVKELVGIWKQIMKEPEVEKTKELLAKASELLGQMKHLTSR
jgi:hypothetical protein